MKTTDDMSMEDILASIRKYVSSTNEPSKYDKKLGASLSSVQSNTKSHINSSAKVIPIKAESAEEIQIDEMLEEEEIVVEKKPVMFEKALSKMKENKKSAVISEPFGEDFSEIVSDSISQSFSKSISNSVSSSVSDSISSSNLMVFIKKSFEEKIQKWIDENLESMIEKRINIILERVAHEHINKLLKEDSSTRF